MAQSEPFLVLVVDDERLFARTLARVLECEGMMAHVAHTAAEALERATSGARYDAVLLDHKLPDDDGIRLIGPLMARLPGVPVVVMTAYDSIPSAVQAMRQGAEDYLVKQTDLRPIVEKVLELEKKRDLRRKASQWDAHKEGGILGESPAIRTVKDQLERVARKTDTTVLLTGETGVGKEVAARWLHKRSRPEGSPFVAVDCAALPANLVESLLFGHERGAFTGAERTRKGAFEEAGNGTIFLDEIGEMEVGLQGKLLRVLEGRAYCRVGSVQERPVEARVIAATNRDLMELVKAGRFRFDLYQRLSVFPVHIPPLRRRGDDILLLAEHFIAFFCSKMGVRRKSLAKEARQLLLNYDYPGNVRELKNIIERALILCDTDTISAEHLPDRVVAGGRDRTDDLALDFVPGIDTLESLEYRLIRQALRESGGVKSRAAKLLGISRFQLLRRMEKYGLKSSRRKRNPK